jgi:hypothetical protein
MIKATMQNVSQSAVLFLFYAATHFKNDVQIRENLKNDVQNGKCFKNDAQISGKLQE